MNISCLQENLQRGLAHVARAVASKSTLPVLGNILLATDRGEVRASGDRAAALITIAVDGDCQRLRPAPVDADEEISRRAYSGHGATSPSAARTEP